MHSIFEIGNFHIPSYGLLVLLGIMVINCLSMIIAEHHNSSYREALLLGTYGFVGAIAGAKCYSLVLAELDSEWTLKISWDVLKNSGYAFYGGLMLGLPCVYLAARIHRIDFETYTKQFTFLAPLFHAFWKTGCLLGGCCYGIEYNGPMAMTFSEGVPAPAGIALFPVQLLELLVLIIIATALYIWGKAGKSDAVGLYLILYGATRCGIEFLRYHMSKTRLVCNVIISILYVVFAASSIVYKRKRSVNGGLVSE